MKLAALAVAKSIFGPRHEEFEMPAWVRSVAVLLSVASWPAFGQTEPTTNPPPAQAEMTGAAAGAALAPAAALINVELNKLETTENGCRAFFVVENRTPELLSELRLIVYFFDNDGVIIGNSVALPFEDLRSNRVEVATFDLPELACGNVGRMLVTEVLACTGSGGAVEGCAEMVATSTRTDVAFEY